MTLTVLDLVVLEDLDFDIVCEGGHDVAAEWVQIHKCCAAKHLICNSHKKKAEGWFNKTNSVVTCKNCGAKASVDFVSLNGKVGDP